MADIVLLKDVASLLEPALASAFTSVTAGGTGDNTAVTGTTLDRFALGGGSLPLTVEFVLAWTATLAANKSLTFKNLKVEQSSDGSNWDSTAYATFTDPGAVATSAGGGTVTGVTKVGLDIKGAKRYIRFDWTPDLTASGTDTATVVAMAVLAGFDRLPAP